MQRGQPLGTEGAVRDALDGSAGTDAVQPQFVPLPGELAPGGRLPVRLAVLLRGRPDSSLALNATGVHELLVNVNGVPEDGARARLAAVRMLLPVLSLPPDPASPTDTGVPPDRAHRVAVHAALPDRGRAAAAAHRARRADPAHRRRAGHLAGPGRTAGRPGRRAGHGAGRLPGARCHLPGHRPRPGGDRGGDAVRVPGRRGRGRAAGARRRGRGGRPLGGRADRRGPRGLRAGAAVRRRRPGRAEPGRAGRAGGDRADRGPAAADRPAGHPGPRSGRVAGGRRRRRGRRWTASRTPAAARCCCPRTASSRAAPSCAPGWCRSRTAGLRSSRCSPIRCWAWPRPDPGSRA